jgi:hypothetical protein
MIIPRMPSSRPSTVRKKICRLLPSFAGTGFGTVAKLCQELAVVFEIDLQHQRDVQDELSMRDGMEGVVKEPILLIAMLVITGLEIRIVVTKGGLGRLGGLKPGIWTLPDSNCCISLRKWVWQTWFH